MTTPQTVAGAIRARLIQVFPELQVYRNEAPEGTQTPVVIITDGLNVQGEDLGDDLLLTEQVQVDLYIDYAQVTNWADQIHAALHRAPISVPGSQIHRCLVTERINQPADAGNEDGVERITFTVLVRRRMSATEYGNLPIQPTPTQLEIHEAQTTNVHGIADTAELETQTGAQAKADIAQSNAISAANAYTNVAAAAAQANAVAISKNYTDTEVIKLTSGTTDFESAQFNTAAGVPVGVGELAWNDTDGTLDLGLKGGNVTLQIGQENVQMVHNGNGTAMTDGQAVYVYGAQGNRLSVKLAQGNSEANSSKTFGVVTEPIGANQNGFVTYSGLVRNINTSAYAEGAALWLSPTTPGALTTTKPQAPNHGVLMGWCVRSHAQVGSIFVHVQNGLELDELHNVQITNPTDGQVLAYNATSGLWKAVTFTGGGDPAGTAAALVAAHEAAVDPHGDRAYTDTEIAALSTVYEPAGAVADHVAAVDPHGDRAYADSLATNYDPAGEAASEVAAHVAAVDPHGDRAYADSLAPNYAPATGIDPTAITGTAVITTDPRLSDSRTPTAHAASHADGGSDEIAVAPAQITQAGATSGQVLSWSGTQWAPATPAAGGGTAKWLDNMPKSLPLELLGNSGTGVGDIAVYTRAQSGGTISKIGLVMASTPASVSAVSLGVYQNVPGANFRLDLPGSRLTVASGTPTASQTTPFLYELTLPSPITVAPDDWFAMYIAVAGNKPAYFFTNNPASRAMNITRYQTTAGGLPATGVVLSGTGTFGTPAIIGIP